MKSDLQNVAALPKRKLLLSVIARSILSGPNPILFACCSLAVIVTCVTMRVKADDWVLTGRMLPLVSEVANHKPEGWILLAGGVCGFIYLIVCSMLHRVLNSAENAMLRKGFSMIQEASHTAAGERSRTLLTRTGRAFTKLLKRYNRLRSRAADVLAICATCLLLVTIFDIGYGHYIHSIVAGQFFLFWCLYEILMSISAKPAREMYLACAFADSVLTRDSHAKIESLEKFDKACGQLQSGTPQATPHLGAVAPASPPKETNADGKEVATSQEVVIPVSPPFLQAFYLDGQSPEQKMSRRRTGQFPSPSEEVVNEQEILFEKDLSEITNQVVMDDITFLVNELENVLKREVSAAEIEGIASGRTRRVSTGSSTDTLDTLDNLSLADEEVSWDEISLAGQQPKEKKEKKEGEHVKPISIKSMQVQFRKMAQYHSRMSLYRTIITVLSIISSPAIGWLGSGFVLYKMGLYNFNNPVIWDVASGFQYINILAVLLFIMTFAGDLRHFSKLRVNTEIASRNETVREKYAQMVQDMRTSDESTPEQKKRVWA